MKAGSCVFQNSGMLKIYYIDSFIVFFENNAPIDKLQEDLRKTFRTKDLGTLSQFISIDLNWIEKCSIKL